MRKYYFLIILTALFSCQKDELEIKPVDNNIIDLHDTIISLNWSYGSTNFNLDIDKDSVNDIIMTVYSYYSSFAGAENYIKVTPSNGFEIAFTNITATTWSWNPTMSDKLFSTDTITVPKTFHIGDTINVKDMYSEGSQMINYSYFPTGPGVEYYSGLRYGIQEDNYFYLGFCKIGNGVSRLAWLKIKYSSGWIILNSCNYYDGEKFTIKEKI
jgi:hypothetical protein